MINDKDILNAVTLLLMKYRKVKQIPDTRILNAMEITEFLGSVCQVILQHEGIRNNQWGLIFKEDNSDFIQDDE